MKLRGISLLLFTCLSAYCFVGLSSCKADVEEPADKLVGDEIMGLASPISLRLDSSQVNLADYFPNQAIFGSIKWDDGEVRLGHKVGIITLVGAGESATSNLRIETECCTYDIPVFASEKIRHTIIVKGFGDANTVEIAGSFNGWNPKATPLGKEEGGWQTGVILNPGEYAYQVVVDGAWQLDPNNGIKKSNGQGGFNSIFRLGSDAPQPVVLSEIHNGAIRLIHEDGVKSIAYWNNLQIEVKDNLIEIPLEARKHERSFIRVLPHQGSQRGGDLLIPLENGIPVVEAASIGRKDWHSMIMYFAMVDRFKDGNEENNRPVDDPTILPQANNLGGDLSGIQQKITDGYFEELGVNTIWLSPIAQNPEGAWGLWDKGVTSKFSGYHGYWPISSSVVDDRLGSETSFKELIDQAHLSEINVLLDYVANHVHQEHPVYMQHKDWATPLYLPDGTMNTEKWDEHRLTTWFDTFLPTLDLSKPEVAEAMTDSALFWLTAYDLDGFRHDATKHIPESFWRLLTQKIKNRVERDGSDVYQIGETYGNPELISSYVTTGQLDAQFDFNLYDALVDALAKPETGFKNLERVLEESLHYYGSHHLMGNITGNQDRTRFISYADGSVDFGEDSKLAGWTREITNQGSKGYKSLQMLHAFLMTAPGIPTIYYGDEIGMPGANDPDNRRMMTFDGWNEDQRTTYDIVKELANLRRERMSLMYGNTYIHLADDDAFVMLRTYMDETTVLVLNKTDSELEIDIPLHAAVDAQIEKVIRSSANWDGERLVVSTPKGFGVVCLD